MYKKAKMVLFPIILLFGPLFCLSAGEMNFTITVSEITATVDHPAFSPDSLEIRPSFLPRDGFIRKPFMRKKIRAAWMNWTFWPVAFLVTGSLLYFIVLRKKRGREFFLHWEMLGYLIYLSIIALTVFNSPRLTHADLEIYHYQFSFLAFFKAISMTSLPAVVNCILSMIRRMKPSRIIKETILMFFLGYFYTASLYILAHPMSEFI